MAYSILTEEPRTLLSGISCETIFSMGLTQGKLRWDELTDPARRTEHPNCFLILRRDGCQRQMGLIARLFSLEWQLNNCSFGLMIPFSSRPRSEAAESLLRF